jgi:hypothetical protein
VAKPLGVAKQGLGVGKQVVADGDRLRALEVRVARHHPPRMPARLRGEGLDHTGDS